MKGYLLDPYQKTIARVDVVTGNHDEWRRLTGHRRFDVATVVDDEHVLGLAIVEEHGLDDGAPAALFEGYAWPLADRVLLMGEALGTGATADFPLDIAALQARITWISGTQAQAYVRQTQDAAAAAHRAEGRHVEQEGFINIITGGK